MQGFRLRVIVLAIILFAYGIWLSRPMFVSGSDLTRISGKLDTAYINITTVSSTSDNQGIRNTSYSQKATLTFKILGHNETYSIAKNIGDRDEDEAYNQILSGLQGTNIVSVWIQTKDSVYINPDVYQIYADKTPLMLLKDEKEKDLPIVIFLFSMGALLVALIFWSDRRVRLRARAQSESSG